MLRHDHKIEKLLTIARLQEWSMSRTLQVHLQKRFGLKPEVIVNALQGLSWQPRKVASDWGQVMAQVLKSAKSVNRSKSRSAVDLQQPEGDIQGNDCFEGTSVTVQMAEEELDRLAVLYEGTGDMDSEVGCHVTPPLV
jgi:hypothetical protein